MKYVIALLACALTTPALADEPAATPATEQGMPVEVAADASDVVHQGGNAASLFSLEQTNVRFLDQSIEMEGGVHTWKVVATFRFQNSADKPSTVLMGFPLYKCDGHVCEENEDGDVVCLPCDALTDVQRADEALRQANLIHNFRAIVRGKPVESHKVDLAKSVQGYRQAFIFEVNFQPGEVVEIINHYNVDATWREAIETYGDPEQIYASVVMRPANAWLDGKLDHSKIEIRPHFPWSPCNGRTPGKMEKDGHKRKLVLERSDLIPEHDLQICLMDHRTMTFPTSENTRMNLRDCEWNLDNLSPEDLRRCRNLPYALHGYPFKSKAMLDIFQPQKWYQPRADFSPTMITQREWSLIDKIKAREQAIKAVESTQQAEPLPERPSTNPTPAP